MESSCNYFVSCNFRIQIIVLFIILNSSLIVHVHGSEEFDGYNYKEITDQSEAGNSEVTPNEGLEIRTGRLERDLRREKEARKNLEEKIKQMQEKLSSVVNFKDSIESTSQTYRNVSSSVTSIMAIRGLRGLENIVTNLTERMSTFDNNILRLENEVKDSQNSRRHSQLNETLPENKNFVNTGYHSMTCEILSRVQQLESKGTYYEDITNTDREYESESKYSQQYVPCKEGWFLYGEKCYKIFPERREWKEASQSCSSQGGHLATVSSIELQEFVNIFFLLNERVAAWIGASDREKESFFVWEDGSPFSFTFWDHDQPDDGDINRKEDCIEMRYGVRTRSNPRELGYWNDLGCDARLPYVCQLDRNKGVEQLSPDPRFCSINEGGGYKYRETCFHIVRTKKSWEEAQKHCEENFSGNLVTIVDTEAEMFLNYILSDINEDFWIGIRRQDQDIQKWISGWTVVFSRLNPDLKESPRGTCVLRAKNKLWTAAECFNEFPFICEKTKNAAPVLKKAPEGWQCPKTSEEWLDLGGEFCYIFGADMNFNWHEANNYCQRKGGHLASISSKDDSLILQYHVMWTSRAFIGLQRSLSNKYAFEWVDGSNVGYTNWGKNEPSSVEEECVEMKIKYLEYDYSWNDVHCTNARGAASICSTKKVPPTATK